MGRGGDVRGVSEAPSKAVSPGTAVPKLWSTGKDSWIHGSQIPGERHRNLGPCPVCGARTFDYGGGWSCVEWFCYNSANNPAPTVGEEPWWWSTEIQVRFVGYANWHAERGGRIARGGTPGQAAGLLRHDEEKAARPAEPPVRDEDPLTVSDYLDTRGADVFLENLARWDTDFGGWMRRHWQRSRSQPSRPPTPDAGHPHLIAGEFQSDKYPTTPRGKVPLSCKDPTAQDLLWTYAQRRRAVDAEFATDLEIALRNHGYEFSRPAGEETTDEAGILPRDA